MNAYVNPTSMLDPEDGREREELRPERAELHSGTAVDGGRGQSGLAPAAPA